jgi:hypothetical protein
MAQSHRNRSETGTGCACSGGRRVGGKEPRWGARAFAKDSTDNEVFSNPEGFWGTTQEGHPSP